MKEIIIKQLTANEFEQKEIMEWPIWEKEISKFPWTYDQDEECFIIEGEIIVYVNDKIYNIKASDFVFFPKGLSCVWEIKKEVKKYYNFI